MAALIPFLVLSAALNDQTLVIEGRDLARVLAVEGGRLSTKSIRNGQTGTTLRVAGPEFTLSYGDGDFASSDDFAVVSLEKIGRAHV